MLKGVHAKLIAILGVDDTATLHQCLCELDTLKTRRSNV